ncbi:hypothetical protein [Oleiharenicola lentus]|uniref:hypothetical protein n=1 Tax=Oleiharenicola lentus TaxID=2508720 RepID=UPI003F66C29D
MTYKNWRLAFAMITAGTWSALGGAWLIRTAESCGNLLFGAVVIAGLLLGAAASFAVYHLPIKFGATISALGIAANYYFWHHILAA